MKNTRKLVCFLLAALLLVLSAAPAFATSISAPTKIYLNGSSNEGFASIYINNLSANSKITDIKSSSPSILYPTNLVRNTSDWQSLEDTDEKGSDYDAELSVTGIKAGTATISFKVDGKTYSKKITVLGYKNPIKSLVITGIGKANLKTRFAKENYYQQKLKKNAKAGKIKVKAASGWKIRAISWSDNGVNGVQRMMQMSRGMSSMNLAIPAMKKAGSYTITIWCYNTKTQASVWITYSIG